MEAAGRYEQNEEFFVRMFKDLEPGLLACSFSYNKKPMVGQNIQHIIWRSYIIGLSVIGAQWKVE